MYNHAVPAKEPKREFKVGDKIRVNLHHGKIEDAVVRAVIQDEDGTKLHVNGVGLDLWVANCYFAPVLSQESLSGLL